MKTVKSSDYYLYVDTYSDFRPRRVSEHHIWELNISFQVLWSDSMWWTAVNWWFLQFWNISKFVFTSPDHFTQIYGGTFNLANLICTETNYKTRGSQGPKGQVAHLVTTGRIFFKIDGCALFYCSLHSSDQH